ncbi:hypothetical protein [Nocardia higoensis]|uniref:hypothetical protein n=1 Tax=Nocardia higoensis TaxID=228599 RepID=UPI0002E15003|nr:hypothetical protein [Nocardia higoensis]
MIGHDTGRDPVRFAVLNYPEQLWAGDRRMPRSVLIEPYADQVGGHYRHHLKPDDSSLIAAVARGPAPEAAGPQHCLFWVAAPVYVEGGRRPAQPAKGEPE